MIEHTTRLVPTKLEKILLQLLAGRSVSKPGKAMFIALENLTLLPTTMGRVQRSKSKGHMQEEGLEAEVRKCARRFPI